MIATVTAEIENLQKVIKGIRTGWLSQYISRHFRWNLSELQNGLQESRFKMMHESNLEIKRRDKDVL